jgi:hypothetical protein
VTGVTGVNGFGVIGAEIILATVGDILEEDCITVDVVIVVGISGSWMDMTECKEEEEVGTKLLLLLGLTKGVLTSNGGATIVVVGGVGVGDDKGDLISEGSGIAIPGDNLVVVVACARCFLPLLSSSESWNSYTSADPLRTSSFSRSDEPCRDFVEHEVLRAGIADKSEFLSSDKLPGNESSDDLRDTISGVAGRCGDLSYFMSRSGDVLR